MLHGGGLVVGEPLTGKFGTLLAVFTGNEAEKMVHTISESSWEV